MHYHFVTKERMKREIKVRRAAWCGRCETAAPPPPVLTGHVLSPPPVLTGHVSPAESPAGPQAGRFLEHANVHGNIYGTSFDAIRAVSDAVRALLLSPRECSPPQILGVSKRMVTLEYLVSLREW